MKKTFLLLLLALACLRPAAGQIVISAADVRATLRPQMTTTTYEAEDPTPAQALAGLDGGNRTYDLRGLTWNQASVVKSMQVSCASPVPGCDVPEFQSADLIMHSETVGEQGSGGYGFMRIASDGYTMLGSAGEEDFDPERPGLERMTLVTTPAMLLQKLPLKMGTSWANDVTETITSTGQEPFSWQFQDENVVDGWGTLITPEGSFPALRVRSRNISITTYMGMEMRDTSYTIDLVTKSNVGASLDVEADGTVSGVSYTVAQGGTGTDAGDDGAPLPTQISLAPAYPNPFNPSTTFSYTMAQSGPVRLTVFDVLGREVARLVDGMQAAGTHQVTWDAAGLPSGSYLYRLEGGGTSLTRQVVLLK